MRFLKKIIWLVYYRMLLYYLRLRFWYPVWFYILNREGKDSYRQEKFKLNALERRIVRDLKKDGIAIAHISELLPKETWEELKKYTADISQTPKILKLIAAKEAEPPAEKSDIIIHILGGYGDTTPILNFRDPFIRFVSSNTIIKTAASYLQILPKLRMFSLHSTILLPPSAPTVFSQNWHRDPDDMKIVKVFLYLSDVDSIKAGPFTYICGSQYGGKWRNIFPQRPPMGSYPPKEELESLVKPKDIKICTGKAGTLIFCDTSGLHRGGHSVDKRRIMFAGTFVTEAGLKYHKPNYRIKSRKKDMSSLSKIARYSLS